MDTTNNIAPTTFYKNRYSFSPIDQYRSLEADIVQKDIDTMKREITPPCSMTIRAAELDIMDYYRQLPSGHHSPGNVYPPDELLILFVIRRLQVESFGYPHKIMGNPVIQITHEANHS